MAKLATFLRSRQKGWELDRYEFSPWWHKYSMFLNSFLPNLQGEKYSFAEVTLTRLVPFWGDLPMTPNYFLKVNYLDYLWPSSWSHMMITILSPNDGQDHTYRAFMSNLWRFKFYRDMSSVWKYIIWANCAFVIWWPQYHHHMTIKHPFYQISAHLPRV